MAATTINVHKDILRIITLAALRSGRSRRAIIIEVLMKMMHDLDRRIFKQTTMQYQTTQKKDLWHCFHIWFDEDEYEYFNDLKKITKCSLSLLIALAVKKYIDRNGADRGSQRTTYPPYDHYVMVTEIIDGITSWRYFWGLPINYVHTLDYGDQTDASVT